MPRVAWVAPPRSVTHEFPAVAEAQVQRWALRYSQQAELRARFVAAVVRAEPYAPMIAAKLRRAGLPGALIYLPIVESSYRAGARSRVGAVGLWQFMPGTARAYGLRIDRWVDERRDPYKSTDAAVRHLSDLYREYRNWYLALAAYNAGATRVARAVRASQTSGRPASYWRSQPYLPAETQDYVPQLLGVARLGAHPTRYGIAVPAVPPAPPLVRVMVPPSSRLSALAAVWGISLPELSALNPALRWAASPPDGPYAVVLPADDALTKRDRFFELPSRDRCLTPREIVMIGSVGNQGGR